jgi:primosomal protein N' (replication factor Y)
LAALASADRVLPVSRSEERQGWPAVEIIDRRSEEPGRGGLFSERAAEVLRTAERPVAILNRKGRAAMLACASCGELVRTEDGSRLMVERDGGLVQPETGESRPLICAVCTGTTLKRIRLGVTRAAEELAHLVGRPVTELSADTDRLDRASVVLGTEAALHADIAADAVVFLDMDQELLAPRYRAAEQAMGLLVRAARLIGGRRRGAPIVVQTRSPEHRVLRAAVAADPSRMVDEELAVRTALGFPPAGALAEVGGAGAASFLAPLAGRDDVMVLGPRDDGRHLLRTDDAESLAEVLASLPRPKERVRVAVDPPRA